MIALSCSQSRAPFASTQRLRPQRDGCIECGMCHGKIVNDAVAPGWAPGSVIGGQRLEKTRWRSLTESEQSRLPPARCAICCAVPSMNPGSIIGDLNCIAVVELQNGPARLYRYPCPGVRGIGFAARCYLYAVHQNEKLVADFFDLHRGLFRHLELAATRAFEEVS
jgi:hypothetical protein